jgi:hypothetical protein
MAITFYALRQPSRQVNVRLTKFSGPIHYSRPDEQLILI